MTEILFKELKTNALLSPDATKVAQYTISSLKQIASVLQQRVKTSSYLSPETKHIIDNFSKSISAILCVLTEQDLCACDNDFLEELETLVGLHIRNPQPGISMSYYKSLQELDSKICRLLNEKQHRHSFQKDKYSKYNRYMD